LKVVAELPTEVTMRWASDAEETSRATIRRSEGESIKDKHKRENGETAKRDLSTAIKPHPSQKRA